MELGVQPQGNGIDGIAWHILGHTYTPMARSEQSMAWHADFPDGTFVPPHIHRSQDEFIYMLEGALQVDSEGRTDHAKPGDLIRLPMGTPHGLFNRSGAMVRCLFWVAPTARLWELFVAIDGVPDPAEVVRLAALHEVDFLPPPG
jgi:quercetin dioxygenase-like cupin family protein